MKKDFYIFKIGGDPKNPVAGPISATSPGQALGFYITVVLKKAVEYRQLKTKYYALDAKQVAKRRQAEPETQQEGAAKRQYEVQALFENSECICGGSREIEDGVWETRCPICGGYTAIAV